MSIIGGHIRMSAISDLQHPTAWLTTAFGGGRRAASGADVTPTSVLTLAVYWACVQAIAQDVAKTPLHLYRKEGRAKEKAKEEPLYYLLKSAPNDEMTAIGFRETVTQWALGWTAGFAEIERKGSGVEALWPIHPSRVKPVRHDGALFWRVRGTWTDDTTGTRHEADVDIPDADMLVIHGVGNDGITGYSVMSLATESAGIGIALNTYAANFFGGSTSVAAVITMDKEPTEQIKEKMRAEWDERYSGPNANRRPMIFPSSTKFERIDVDPEKAQAIESRDFQVKDIARYFRMPLSKIGAGAASAGERESIDYVTDTLMAWYERWEQEIDRKLIRPSDRGTLEAKHAVQGLMRGDHAARSAFYSAMLGKGVYTINEVREMEEKNPVEGGDTHFVPVNTIPLESAGAYADAEIKSRLAAHERTTRNPTDEGGGANNAPKETQAAPDFAVIAMGFLAPITQRLAVKEAKELDKRGRQAAKDFTAWVDGPWYANLRVEAEECLADPMVSFGRLTGVPQSVDLAAWYDTHRRLAIEAYKTGTVATRVAALGTSVGGEMARMLVEGK